MSLLNGQSSWSSSSMHNGTPIKISQQPDDASARNMTPIDGTAPLLPEASLDAEDESRRALFANLFRKTEDKIAVLFSEDGSYNHGAIDALRVRRTPGPIALPPTTDHEPIQEPPMKKAKRSIDEDDYDDDDEDEEESEQLASKSQTTHAAGLLSPSKSGSSPGLRQQSPTKATEKPNGPDGSQSKDSPGDGAIKSLDDAQEAAEVSAKKNFHSIIYTLENDRTAMLEQQQLEDSEKQLQAEMDHNSSSNAAGSQGANQGSLSSANLGASSLTLKHLIARIDLKRDQVLASDAELRLLMNEVRKNRSKWASEENVNQEELYDALEKVLTELKAHTEYSTPFLTRVNKRDAPDYYNCQLI
jgi:transcriptional activator SPT7